VHSTRRERRRQLQRRRGRCQRQGIGWELYHTGTQGHIYTHHSKQPGVLGLSPTLSRPQASGRPRGSWGSLGSRRRGGETTKRTHIASLLAAFDGHCGERVVVRRPQARFWRHLNAHRHSSGCQPRPGGDGDGETQRKEGGHSPRGR
jgi:hypothetical protein